jgi:hypothetical protein
MIRTILPACAALLIASAAEAGEFECQAITIAQFGALKMGSSYADAVKVLGCEGQEMSRFELAVPDYPNPRMTTVSTVMYAWRSENPFSSVTAMFQNDKMISRAQFGLPAGRHP